MKTSTILLIGGAAVVGYLYAQRKGASEPEAIARTLDAVNRQQPINVTVFDAEPTAWGWGVPVFGARSWGVFRGGHGHHGGGHGGHRGGRR